MSRSHRIPSHRAPPGTIFRVVTADPPWPYGDKLPGETRGAGSNYRLQPMDGIKQQLERTLKKYGWQLADDCVLFLWSVEPMPQEALDTVAAWGFKYSTAGVWVKTTRDPIDLSSFIEARMDDITDADGAATDTPEWKQLRQLRMLLKGMTAVSPTFPMGRTQRVCTERYLIAKRGRRDPKVRNQRNVFFAKVGEHSEKPDVFYRRVEELFDGPYLELYGRKRRPGWTVVGDQVK